MNDEKYEGIKETLAAIDALIVDEASMIRARTSDHMEAICRPVKDTRTVWWGATNHGFGPLATATSARPAPR